LATKTEPAIAFGKIFKGIFSNESTIFITQAVYFNLSAKIGANSTIS
jgi:hypothetical protein